MIGKNSIHGCSMQVMRSIPHKVRVNIQVQDDLKFSVDKIAFIIPDLNNLY
jgi:hypothetical protein